MQELNPSGQFENLGAVEVVPAPSISETPETQFTHLAQSKLLPQSQANRADAGAEMTSTR